MSSRSDIILVTAAAGDIGSSAVRALQESQAGIVGTDMNDLCPVRPILRAFYKSPPASDTSAYLDFLVNIVKKEGVRFLLPISEPEIEVLSQQRAVFEELDVNLLLNSEDVIDNFSDKLSAMSYLADLGIRVPKTALLSKYDGSFGFPVIVKARKGCGSRSLWIADDYRDVEYLRGKDDGGLIVQELVGSEDEEYTTAVFSDGDRVSSISFRRRLGYGGMSREARLVDEPLLSELSSKVARAVHLQGSINIQTRRAGGVFIPFEINPRLSSTVLFRKHFGFNDAVWWMDVLVGRGYSYEQRYLKGVAVRCVSECYFDMEEA